MRWSCRCGKAFPSPPAVISAAAATSRATVASKAGDVAAVLDYASAQPWADKSRIVVVGQSHGGWTTLAFGTLHYPGVKGLIDFAGGLRQENCVGWAERPDRCGRHLRKETHALALVLRRQRQLLSALRWKGMHESYVAAGGQARPVGSSELLGGDSALPCSSLLPGHLSGSRKLLTSCVRSACLTSP